MAMQPERSGLQWGLLVRHSGGCLSPRVLDFLCFDTPRSVLASEDGEEELPFYVVAQQNLEGYVRQGLLPCPAVWVEHSALAAGSGTLRVLYRLGGALQHCALPGKPIKMQPVKQGGATQQPNGSNSRAAQHSGGAAACRAFVSSKRHTQVYRLVVGLFPKLEQLHQELNSGAVMMGRAAAAAAQQWAPAGLQAVRATSMRQGVLLERLNGSGSAQQLIISVDFGHACLVLKDAPGPGSTPDCLRTVNSLAEALTVLHRETGRLGPSLTASPVKAAGGGTVFQSPAKPPLPAGHGADALRLAVNLVQECGLSQLREGLAILSAAAGRPQLCSAAIGFGAMEALVTAAATVLPSSMMGMAELQPSIEMAVTSLLDAAPPSAYAAGRLVSILAAVLQQSCANPLLLCRLMLAVLQRADVRAEAMRQGLAGNIADMYLHMSPTAEAAAAELLPPSSTPAAWAQGVSDEQQPQQLLLRGFGSPLLPAAPCENRAAASNKHGQVAHLVATYNGMSDSGSDCSPSASRSASPVKGSPMRSPSALSNTGRFAVPRLTLPTCESPTHATGGLTRSTRRVLGNTPGGTRSPSPFGSPTRRSGTCDSGAEPAALAALATLASALGESLMAADLPAIVAHKRQADARLADPEDDVPAALLEAPPGTAKKVLAAHRILVTARSLRSVDSSPSRTTDTDSATAAGSARSGRLPVDVEQLKCLLLKALVVALPLLEPAGWPAQDLALVLAAEVVSMLGKPLSAQQEQLKGLAVQALLRLSQRPSVPGAHQQQAAEGSSNAVAHVLVAAAGSRLRSLGRDGKAEGAAWTELQAALQLLTDYTAAVQEPSVATAVVQHCLPGMQSLMGVLQAGGLDAAAWGPPTWQLLHSLVVLLAAVCQKCHNAEAGRGILALLLADHQTAAMLAGAASHTLLQSEQPRSFSMVQRSRTAALQRDLLQLFAALAALVGRQPPCVHQPHHARASDSTGRAGSRLSFASSGPEDLGTSREKQQGPAQDLLLGLSARRGLTRRQALLFFGFLVSPHSGLAQRILDHDPVASVPAAGHGKPKQQQQQQPVPPVPSTPASPANVKLRQGLLELLKAVFAAPGSPFAADKFVSDFYIRFHFIQFLKLYHNPHRDHQALFLCRQHMDTLLVLAANRSGHIRHRFHQLSVVDFFVRELSLEFEAKQPTRGRMHRQSSGGSVLEHRRTSSSSTLAGFESGSASPVLSMRLPTVPEPEQQLGLGLPAGVPLLRLPSRGALAAGGAPGSGATSPALPAGAGGRGFPVPRLNLGPAPSLPSPGSETTPSPGNSARHGRPPLPPSARSGCAPTPRLTSRLGRTMSARSGDSSIIAAAATAVAVAAAPPAQQQSSLPAIATRHASGGKAPAHGSVPKFAVPKLGLAGIGRSLAAGAAAGAGAAEPPAPPALAAGPETRSNSRVHFSPSPPRSAPSDDDDSDSDSSDDGEAAAVVSGGSAAGSGRPTPPLGLDVPAGFTFTGDLEEDLDRLEALENEDTGDEDCDYEATDSESASPTIPALRNSPFQASSPGPLVLGLPRAKAYLPGHTPPPQQPTGGDQPGSGDGLRGMAIPRLNLSHSMHSTMETRNASAELQLAADAEQAKAKQGRNVLGELERSALGKGKMQAASFRHLNSSLSDISGATAVDVSYSEERSRRLLYRDEGLHLEVLQLVFTLIFTEEGQLDSTYCDQYPWERKLQNIPFILYHHLNHEDSRPLLPHLLPRLHGAGPAAVRMLRVLCSAFFRPEWYSGRARISSAVGAYSTVYRATLPAWAGEASVVLKLVDTPKHIQDRCAQVDFQGEVSILDTLAGSPRACQMFDYGVDPAAEAMFLVLKGYRCSLRQWRAKQPASPAGQLRLYYAIFSEVAAAVGALLERGVVHFDIKCDNCLLEPLPGVGEAEFWSPSSERLPFRVVLADFGESKAFSEGADGGITARARGTDCFKSPEMLMVGGASHKEQRYYDRRRRQGAGPASDVWSLGCLLYELVVGKLLFNDNDWLQLVARVTSPSMPLITEDRAALVAGLPGMMDLLHFMLVRDARMRPTLTDVQARLAATRSSSRVRLPAHVRTAAIPLSSRGLHPTGSQLFSPTSYVPSPKASMPMPLLAALPLSGQLVLAPLALLSSTAALEQHAARRVVLLFAGAASCGGPAAAATAAGSASQRQLGGLLSPGSPGGASDSSLDSSLDGSRRYGDDQRTPDYMFAANPVFSMGGDSDAASSAAAAHTSARTLIGTPRMALRFGAAAVHPEPEGGGGGTAAAAAGSARGSSSARQKQSSARVHPDPDDPACSTARHAQPAGPRLVLPLPAVAPGSARSLGGSSRPVEDALLLRVLSDAELAAAASSCNAAGVECCLVRARAAGSERGMQQPLALAHWLSQHALPLLNGGSGQQRPVLLAVQAGCEAEGAMAAVAHLMQQRQVSLYQAMVASSQWGIDLHLRQHHLLALQHWAATDSHNLGSSSSGRR